MALRQYATCSFVSTSGMQISTRLLRSGSEVPSTPALEGPASRSGTVGSHHSILEILRQVFCAAGPDAADRSLRDDRAHVAEAEPASVFHLHRDISGAARSHEG